MRDARRVLGENPTGYLALLIDVETVSFADRFGSLGDPQL